MKATLAADSPVASIEIGSAHLSARVLERFLALAAKARVFVHYGLTEYSQAVILAAAVPDQPGERG